MRACHSLIQQLVSWKVRCGDLDYFSMDRPTTWIIQWPSYTTLNGEAPPPLPPCNTFSGKVPPPPFNIALNGKAPHPMYHLQWQSFPTLNELPSMAKLSPPHTTFKSKAPPPPQLVLFNKQSTKESYQYVANNVCITHANATCYSTLHVQGAW